MAGTIWCGDPTEPPPADLQRALAASRVPVLSGGGLATAGLTVSAARRALSELRCGEALPALEQAEGHLLSDVGTEDGRALLGQIEALTLICADRLGDAARATRAADRLLMTGVRPPADVVLILQRYRPAPVQGPPPPPTRVETDPRGASVIRDLLTVGQSPLDVPGGTPQVDTLDVEMPGWRKVHRPLGSGESVALGLRPEDRLPVLVDAVAARPVGSDAQAAALAHFSGALMAGQLPATRVVVLAPRQQGGAAVAGERLVGRVYDVGQRRWLTPVADVPAGTAAQQAAQVLALAEGKQPAVAGQPVPAGKVVAQAPPPDQKQPADFLGLRARFKNTKWYTWVIAGGVVALVAGLLIAEHFATDSVQVHASK